MKLFVQTVLFSSLMSFISITGFAQQNYDLSDLSRLEMKEVDAKIVSYKGSKALHLVIAADHKTIEQGGCDNCSFAKLPISDFHNGTIKIDVAGKPQIGAPEWSRGFVGVVFRVDTESEVYEGVYLRPTNATADNQLQRNHTVQYFSAPGHEWYELRKSDPGKYETHAHVKTGEWTKLRIEVDGDKMRLFIDEHENATLLVNDLKGGKEMNGSIGLFVGPGSDAYFRDLKVTKR